MKKFMSLLLSVLLVLSLVPMTATAAEKDWNGFIYYQDGAVFSVKATEFTGDKDLYDFYAAGYDNTGKLLEIKKGEAEVIDGTLEGEVTFETIVNGAVTKEADPRIKTVKTMVWDGMTPIVRAGLFDNIDDTGLTNGFYEPVLEGKISNEGRTAWRDDEKDGSYNGNFLQTFPDGGKHDGNLTTGSINTGFVNKEEVFTVGNLAVSQYVTELTEAVKIDRVVVYYDVMREQDGGAANEMRFYLAKSIGNYSDGDAYLAAYNETSHDDLTYLGYRGTNAGVVTDDLAKLVFEADGAAYKYLIADMDEYSDYGRVYEWQAYKKAATRTDVVDEFELTKSYNGLAYSQDGPSFTVTAQEFETNAPELYLMATAFDGADATGTVLAQEREKLTEASTLTGTVNLEKNGEVNPLMASVKVEVVDGLGNNVLPAWTKNVTPQRVTGDAYTNFTNGFYEPVIGDDVTVKWSKLFIYNKNANEYVNEGNNSTKLTDHSIATDSRNVYNQNAGAAGAYENWHLNDVVALSKATKIDRIVAFPCSSAAAVKYYLSPTEVAQAGLMNPHFSAMVPESTVYTYLGDSSTAKSVTPTTNAAGNAMSRVVFDTDGGSYQSLIVDYRTGSSSGNYDLQAYRKVQDEYEVSAHITPIYEVAEDAAAFAYGSAEGTTPAMAVDGDANTAWVSTNAAVDSQGKTYRDYLILDLGTAYSVNSLELTLAADSAQNFTVYGSNDGMWLQPDGGQAVRTALTSAITTLTPGTAGTIDNILSDASYRYIIFEQASENTASTSSTGFGFADIKIYTTDAAGAEHEAVGPVVQAAYNADAPVAVANYWLDSPGTVQNDLAVVADADPSTYYAKQISWANGDAAPTYGWGNGQVYMVDLGTAQKITHVGYQAVTSASYWDEATDFLVIASNNLPDRGDAQYTNSSNYVVLGSISGKKIMEKVDYASVNSYKQDSGLQIIESADKENAYRYVGIIKLDASPGSAKSAGTWSQLRLGAGTIQAYVAADTQ